ncbi:MAG: ComF family protein [Saprospiraceae bacterium]|nr:ComF family protein [Saprospiraceae bacterium]
MNKTIHHIRQLFGDMLYTMFPDLCIACIRQPKISGGFFCVECLHNMPYTDHFNIRQNIVTNHFKGRITLHHGAALLTFRDLGIVRNMLHGLKYKGKKETGIILGEIAGRKLIESPLFETPDIMIPVPIHPKKKLIRGYNQSGVFGHGVSVASGVKMSENHLIKYTETASQTGLSRTERVKNVSDTFAVTRTDDIMGRHILVVDDVVTTGATIEACCLKLMEAGAGKLSVLTIAAGG